MSERPINLLSTDAITWLRDMGCDEPTDDIQRTFYGLRSKEKASKVLTNYKPNTELKINTFNIEDIKNINDLYTYVSLNHLLNSNVINQKFIFFDGSDDADLMIIGDKPDIEDFKIGKPFQGGSGNLLDAMLKAIGYNRSNTYFTNMHCYNPEVPIELSLQILKKQIEIVNPKVVIMFGAEVSKCLIKTDKGIFKTRGQWFNLDQFVSNSCISCISMFHPRYVLVHPQSKKESWIDLKTVRDKLS
jgi:uracil-DNA glycosylase family 4